MKAKFQFCRVAVSLTAAFLFGSLALQGQTTTGNLPPTGRIANPAAGQMFMAPAEVAIQVQATDPDGWVRRVEFLANNVRLGVVEVGQNVGSPSGGYPWRWVGVGAGEFVLTAKVTDNLGATVTTEPVRILVVNTRLPHVTVQALDKSGTEVDPLTDRVEDPASFVVSRTEPVDQPLEVAYRVSGSATPGMDYEALPGTVKFEAGSSKATIPVTVLDDKLVEPEEHVVVTLLAPPATSGALPPYGIGTAGQAAVVLLDNDVPPNQPPAVVLVCPPDGAVFVAPESIVLVASAADRDGIVTAVEFFADGVSLGVVQQDITLGPVPMDNSHPELGPISPFRLEWKTPAPGAHKLHAVATDNKGATGESPVAEIRILEASQVPIVTVTATDPEGSESSGVLTVLNPAVFEIERSGPKEAALEVKFKLEGTAKNAVDYTEVPLVVTIPEGQESVEVVIQPINDTLPEGAETVVLALVPPACLDVFPPPAGCYLVGRPSAARAVILDDEGLPNQPPRVGIIHPRSGEVFPAGADILLLAAAGDADGKVAKVEFFAGDTLIGVGVNDPARPEHYRFEWLDVVAGEYTLTAVATDDDGLAQTSTPVRIKVITLQVPPVVTIKATDAEAAETGADATPNPAVFTVHRTGPLTSPLTVYYRADGSAHNGEDYTLLPLKVTIAADAADAEIRIEPKDDTRVEGPETVLLTLLPLSVVPGDGIPVPAHHYIVGMPAAARAVILDDETAANLPPKVAITRPLPGQIFVGAQDIPVVAVARDADGYVPAMEFFAGDTLIKRVERQFLVPPPPGEDHRFEILWPHVAPGTYVLRARATDDDGAQTWSEPVNVAVVTGPLPAVVTVVALDPLAIEPEPEGAADPGAFMVRRVGDLTQALKVKLAIAGTAQNGVDYTRIESEVAFEPNQDAVRVPVVPLGDNAFEGMETVVVELPEMGCIAIFPPPPDCYRVGDLRRAVVKILDPASQNHPPKVEIVRPYPGEAFQAPAPVKIVAMAADADGQVVRVEFFVDGVKQGEVLAPATTAPTREPQGFTFVWENAPVGTHGLTAVAWDDDQASATSREVQIEVFEGTIPPRVSVMTTDPRAAERPENLPANTATFKVHRTGPTDQPLTVKYALGGTAVNGDDYVTLGGAVTLGVGERLGRVVITPINDTRAEPTETVLISLTPDAGYRIAGSGQAGASIVDNDGDEPAVQPLPGGIFQISFRCQDGMPYRIEVSDDLVHWQPVTDALATGGKVQFVQPGSGEWRSSRFYRVRPIIPEALRIDE